MSQFDIGTTVKCDDEKKDKCDDEKKSIFFELNWTTTAKWYFNAKTRPMNEVDLKSGRIEYKSEWENWVLLHCIPIKHGILNERLSDRNEWMNECIAYAVRLLAKEKFTFNATVYHTHGCTRERRLNDS